ncbi:MAG: folate-binding protein YgfZ [Acidobacteriota bacterium]|nr:folate-binding protein YgfZ [Acidobacteriota bacterium]
MTLAEDYAALRGAAGARLARRDGLRVTGPDAASYLQGQCSQDVEALSVGDTAEALLLSPQGKLEAYVRVTRTAPDGFLLDVDEGFGGAVLERLQRFRLRVKAELDPVALECLSARGPGAADAVAAVAAEVWAPFSWGPAVGVDLLAPSVDPSAADVRWSGVAAWEALRVEAGIPVMGAELDEQTIAAEAGLLERTVSFTKGCYTGQELVARLDARGNRVARHLRGLVSDAGPGTVPAAADAPAPWPAGTEVVDPAGGKVVGTVTSSAWSPTLGAVALAYLHRSLSPPAAVELRLPGGAAAGAEARPLPLVS